MQVPLVVNEKLRSRERALLTKSCIQIHLEPSKNANDAKRKIQNHTEKLLKKLLNEVLPHRLKKYSEISGFQFKTYRIKKMKSRWGSCSSLGNLNFNIGLALVPIQILDYIVVHELCHIKEANHSSRFWKEVELLMPNYRQAKHWLRENELDILSYFYGWQGKALTKL
ncbi:M48 family metallopeptidase [Leptospira sp. GIMC2001]|nr:M48 family metallopeptidase [Leptospira sp. GIMC2001]WCL47831.1 M48 family metallopeptidase [Leptospira sp. GIMC2001]